MPGFEASITGLGELQSRLSDIGGREAKKVMDKALLAGAKVFQDALFAATPERTDTISGTALPPGALKSDIAIRRTPIVDAETSKFTVGPGKRTEYVARFVEYGHESVRDTSQGVGVAGYKGRNRKSRRGTVVKIVKPNPFIRSTFESQQTAANEAMQASVRADLGALDGGARAVGSAGDGSGGE